MLTPDVALGSVRLLQGDPSRAVLPASKSDWEVATVLLRIHAGLWSGRTALVLSVPFAIAAWARGIEQVWLTFMLLPVVAAFFSGVFLGPAIWDRQEVTDEPLAGRRGALVALVAYVIFAMEVATLSGTPIDSGLNALMGAFVMTGWVVFPAAFLAGILAFRAREGAFRHQTSSNA